MRTVSLIRAPITQLANWANKAGQDTMPRKPPSPITEIRAGQLAASQTLTFLSSMETSHLPSSINQVRTCFRVIERGDNGNHSTSLDGGSNLWEDIGTISTSSIDPSLPINLQRRDGLPVNFNGVSSFKVNYKFYLKLRFSAEIIGKRKALVVIFMASTPMLIYDRALSTSEIETVESTSVQSGNCLGGGAQGPT